MTPTDQLSDVVTTNNSGILAQQIIHLSWKSGISDTSEILIDINKKSRHKDSR